MRSTAVYACVRLICGAIAAMPMQVFKRTDKGRELDRDHQLYPVLHDQPNPMLSAHIYWETAVSALLLAGDSFSIIGRNRQGDPLTLTPIQKKRVEVKELNGRLIYIITFDDGSVVAYDQDDILHIPGVGWDGKNGMSAIAHAGQNAIGNALAADEYSGKYFSNDATPNGYLRYSDKLSDEQAKHIRDYWHRKHLGLDNSHLPAIITEGGEFKQTTINAQDSQLIETRKFQIVDIARIFGVPPHMIGETEKTSSWGTGIEQQSIGFVQYTLRPHLRRIEQEINRKLFANGDSYAEFNVSGLLRGDIKGRNEAYKIALGGNQEPGWMTVNEVRKLENLPPTDDGNTLYKPLTGETANEE
jgi:HK97 family phage portal protein